MFEFGLSKPQHHVLTRQSINSCTSSSLAQGEHNVAQPHTMVSHTQKKTLFAHQLCRARNETLLFTDHSKKEIWAPKFKVSASFVIIAVLLLTY
jgi:hypothetical protein